MRCAPQRFREPRFPASAKSRSMGLNLEIMKAGAASPERANDQSPLQRFNFSTLQPPLRGSTPWPRCEHRDQHHDGADEQNPRGVLSGEFPGGIAFEKFMAATALLGHAHHWFAAARTGGVKEIKNPRPERVHSNPTTTRVPRFAGRLNAWMRCGLSFSPVRNRKLCEVGTHQSHDQSRLRPLF